MAIKYIKSDLAIEKIIDVLTWFDGDEEDGIRACKAIRDYVEKLPSADVRENVRGEWIHKYTHESLHDRIGIWCSVCGKDAMQDGDGYYIEDCETDFCPHCGCSMRGGNA